MKVFTKYCILLLIVIIEGRFHESGVIANDNAIQSDVARMHEKLVHGEVEQIEIVHIPAEVLTGNRVTPDVLEKAFHDKLTIRCIRRRVFEKGLAEAMKSLKVQPTTQGTDLRWGIIFFDRDDQRIGAIYFGRVGNSGAVGNTPMSCNNSLFDWLVSHIFFIKEEDAKADSKSSGQKP
jgi:hypothetical protein